MPVFRAVVLSSVASLQPGVSPNGGAKAVVIEHFQFRPDRTEVHAGDTVEWRNLDIVPHTVTATGNGAFDSGTLAKGAVWRLTFRHRGEYGYECTLHPNMKGKVLVE